VIQIEARGCPKQQNWSRGWDTSNQTSGGTASSSTIGPYHGELEEIQINCHFACGDMMNY